MLLSSMSVMLFETSLQGLTQYYVWFLQKSIEILMQLKLQSGGHFQRPGWTKLGGLSLIYFVKKNHGTRTLLPLITIGHSQYNKNLLN